MDNSTHNIKQDTDLVFIGDPHGRYDDILAVLYKHKPEHVILLGDMTFNEPADSVLFSVTADIWWIHGNHDCDREHWHDNLFASTLNQNNLHGKTKNIAGYNLAGLAGVFRGKIWQPPNSPRYLAREDYIQKMRPAERWRNGLPMKQRASIFPEDFEKLSSQQADILVSHEAPSSHRHGFDALDELAMNMGVKYIVHAHHHIDYQAELANGIQVLGVADGSVARLDGTLLYSRNA